MSTKVRKTTDTTKAAHSAKQPSGSIISSHKTSGAATASQPSAQTTATKRVTTEAINKANALMMKAWDMISQRQHPEVDD